MRFAAFGRSATRLEAFGNLDGVESSTLADLIANNPDVHAVIASEVLADTTDVDVVRAHEIERHRVDVVCRIVAELEAFAVLDSVADFFSTESARSVSKLMASEWQRSAETRTQVAAQRTSLCMIFCVSLNIFISSFV